MSIGEERQMVKRRCRYCGRTFRQFWGEGRRKGCPDCEPPLIPRPETIKPAKAKP